MSRTAAKFGLEYHVMLPEFCAQSAGLSMRQYAGLRDHTMLPEIGHRELLVHMLMMTIDDDDDNGHDHDDD